MGAQHERLGRRAVGRRSTGRYGGHRFIVSMVGVLFFGCGPGGPAVSLVKGVVTLDGAPVVDADVGFSPMTPGQGLSAVGKTAADGTFLLNAQGARPGRGTVAGDYVVTVQKYEKPTLPPDLGSDDPNYGKDVPKGMPAIPKPLIPEKYLTKGTSPLKATVTKVDNFFKFELSSKK